MPVPLAHPSPQVATPKNVSRHCPISLEGQNHPWLRNTTLNCTRTPLRCGVCLSCQLPRPSKLCANYSLSLSQRERGEGKREHLYLPLPYPCAGPDLNIPHLPASIAPSSPLLEHACRRTQQQIMRPGAEREPVLFFSFLYFF